MIPCPNCHGTGWIHHPDNEVGPLAGRDVPCFVCDEDGWITAIPEHV